MMQQDTYRKKLIIEFHPEILGDSLLNISVEKMKLLSDEIFHSAQNQLSYKTIHEKKYTHVYFECSDIAYLWAKVKTALFENNRDIKLLKKGTIIVCEGCNAWDDYLLLYHFDKTEKLDEI